MSSYIVIITPYFLAQSYFGVILPLHFTFQQHLILLKITDEGQYMKHAYGK